MKKSTARKRVKSQEKREEKERELKKKTMKQGRIRKERQENRVQLPVEMTKTNTKGKTLLKSNRRKI